MGWTILIFLTAVIKCNAMLIANQLTDYLRRRHGEKYSNRLQLIGLLLQRDGWTNVLENYKEVDREASLFQTANIVINHFMSSEDMSNFPLRRIQDNNIMNDSSGMLHLFSPLFGPHDYPLKENCSWEHNKSKRKRINLKITVAYRGSDFCGWEDQRHYLYRRELCDNGTNHGQKTDAEVKHALPSVQGTLVDVLDPVFGRSTELNRIRDKQQKVGPIEIKVAGRTDAGVSAVAQICRMRTWRADLPNQQPIDEIGCFVKKLVNQHAKSLDLGLRVMNAEKVSDAFHPTFGAKHRAYAYLIDLQNEKNVSSTEPSITRGIVSILDSMLKSLEGHSLDYVAFSYGKVKTQTTNCTLFHARASLVELNLDCISAEKDMPKKEAICIELVGDRFLRRMVRILVATALRESRAGAKKNDVLLNLLKTKDRSNASPGAPSDGLIFVGAIY